MSGSRDGEPATDVDSVTPLVRTAIVSSVNAPRTHGTRAAPTVGWVRLARVFGGSA